MGEEPKDIETKEGLTVPVKITVSAMVLAGAIWWAATTSEKLNNINQSVLSSQERLQYQIDQISKQVSKIEAEQRDDHAWVISTREKLMAKGLIR